MLCLLVFYLKFFFFFPQSSLSSLRDDNIRASVTAKAKKAKSPEPEVAAAEEEEQDDAEPEPVVDKKKKAKTVVKGPPQATSTDAKKRPQKKEEEAQEEEPEDDDTGGGEPDADAGTDNGELQKMDLEEPEPAEVTGPAEDDNVPVSHKDRQLAPAPAAASMEVVPEAQGTPKKQQQQQPASAAAAAAAKKKAPAVAAKPHVVFFDGTAFGAAASLDELIQVIKTETPDMEKDQMVIYEIEEAWSTFLTDLGAEPQLKELIGYQLDDLKAANVIGAQVTFVMA